MTLSPRLNPSPLSRPGLSLVEAVIAMLILGLAISAALRAVTGARKTDTRLEDFARGKLLGEDLMAEILQKEYRDPVAPVPAFGPESGETSRAQYNDVDDYNGLVESPPRNTDGTSMNEFNNWKRSVKVEFVNATSLTGAASATETSAKRITITVADPAGRTVATLTAVRTDRP